jgi:hypothetical protein
MEGTTLKRGRQWSDVFSLDFDHSIAAIAEALNINEKHEFLQ